MLRKGSRMAFLAWGMTLGYAISNTPMAPGTTAGGYLAVDAPGMARAVADEDLVNQVVIFRNKDLFSVLVERYKGAIFNLIYRTIGSSPEAEDLAQEVFFQVYRSLPAFRNEARFSTWLYRIALNRRLWGWILVVFGLFAGLNNFYHVAPEVVMAIRRLVVPVALIAAGIWLLAREMRRFKTQD